MFTHFLRRVPVRTRIVGGFAILLAILVISVPLVFTNHLALTDRVQQLANVESKSDRLLLQALARILSSRVNLMRYADDLLPSSAEALGDTNQAIALIEESRTLLKLPEQQSATADILAGLVSYNTLITEVQSARNENRTVDLPNLLFNAYRLEFDLEQQIRAVVDENQTQVDLINQEALVNARQRLTLLIVSYLLMLALSMGIAIIIQRSITRPIADLREGAESFRLNRKATTIPIEGTDELSVLAQTFNQITAELSQILIDLEQRVAERTKALATSTEVSRRLSTILDQRQLLTEVVEQVKSSFNYYHAHIYLIDDANENLVMAGGTGDVGQTMLSRGHKIPVGKGLVGRAALTGKPVVVPDTLTDPSWLPNPLLPETKSEIAVPIMAGDQVLGVLDVQNNVAGSLGQQDTELLSSIANQLAVAMRNARIYQQAEDSIEEARSLVAYAPEAIVVIDMETGLFADPNANAEKLYGLPRDELVKVGPARMSPPRQPDGRDSNEKAMEKINEAMQGGTPIFEWTHRDARGNDIPCEVRLVRLPGARPRVRASVTDISERKRLLELTVQRAKQQETLNLITQKIQNAQTIETALQVAVRELGRALGTQTGVQLQPVAVQESPNTTVEESL